MEAQCACKNTAGCVYYNGRLMPISNYLISRKSFTWNTYKLLHDGLGLAASFPATIGNIGKIRFGWPGKRTCWILRAIRVRLQVCSNAQGLILALTCFILNPLQTPTALGPHGRRQPSSGLPIMNQTYPSTTKEIQCHNPDLHPRPQTLNHTPGIFALFLVVIGVESYE